MTLPSLIWGSPQLDGHGGAPVVWPPRPRSSGATCARSRRPSVRVAAATLEGAGVHGSGAQLDRAALDRLAAAPRGQLVRGPGRQQPEPADPRRRRRPARAVTGCATAAARVAVEDAAGSRFRRAQLRVRLAPPRGRRVRRPDVRRRGHRAHDVARRPCRSGSADLPLAGVLLFTDGNGTDSCGEVDWSQLPPDLSGGAAVAPRCQGRRRQRRFRSAQTNFESAPVVIRADVSAIGFPGEQIVAVVADEAGKKVERQVAPVPADGKPLELSIPVPARAQGGQFLSGPCLLGRGREEGRAGRRRRLGGRADAGQQQPARRRRPGGGALPRACMSAGRPDWEFKFLKRAVEEDEEVQLVGLIRIALRQPKFDFRAMHAPARPARCSMGSIIPTPRRPSGRTSRSRSGSEPSTRPS